MVINMRGINFISMNIVEDREISEGWAIVRFFLNSLLTIYFLCKLFVLYNRDRQV